MDHRVSRQVTGLDRPLAGLLESLVLGATSRVRRITAARMAVTCPMSRVLRETPCFSVSNACLVLRGQYTGLWRHLPI